MRTKKQIFKRLVGLTLALSLSLVTNAQSIGGYNVYYGSLHNHSTVSDGSGSPDQAYSTAKANGLDFFSLADHAESTTSTEYTNTQTVANSYNQDGVYTTFYGFEWSHSTYGHIAVINSTDYTTAVANNTFDKLLTWLSTRECIAFFNHPGREGSNSFDRFTDVASDKFVGMELWNKTDGYSEYYYNDGFYTGDGTMGYYEEAVARGWKIGAGGAEDNHGTNWGLMTPYKMAILANNLTRADLYAAMKARRFYSTSDLNIALSFKISDSEMGSTVTGGTLNMLVQATDGNGEAFTQVLLFKNGVEFQTWNINTTSVNQSYSLSAASGDWYYVKVTQADGGEAISSPIWISGGTANQAPTCSITSPSNGATYTAPASLTINANAADSDGAITKVEFYQGTTKLGEDLTSPYSFNWTNVAAGTYSLTVKATDNASAITTSSPVTITVNAAGNIAPTCSITSPANGATYTAPASVTINANAADSDGTITKVEFYQGTTKLGEDLTSPYSFVWSSVAAGSYSLTAKATDNIGAITTSTAIAITVNTSGGTPVTVSKRIATGMDDVEEGKSGSIYTNSSDIELVYDGTTYGNQNVGLRFTGLNIPKGSTITKAYIQFTCDEKKTVATSVTIKGEAADNSAAFTTASKNVSNRVKTTASVAWNSIPSWNTIGAATTNERTPEIKTIVQEIVNRSGFSTSSAMSFIITGTGTRTAEAYEGSSTKAALLYIEYTTPVQAPAIAIEIVPVDSSEISTDIQNTNTELSLTAYPNPVYNNLNIQLNGKNSVINVFDINGKLISQTRSSNNTEVISFANFNQGMYIVEVIQDNSVKTFRIMKK